MTNSLMVTGIKIKVLDNLLGSDVSWCELNDQI